MPNFKDMYYRMFHAMTDAITQMQAAQQAAEAMYMECGQPDMTELENTAMEEEKADSDVQ